MLASIDELVVAVSVGTFAVATVQVAMVEHMLLSLGLLLRFIVMFLQKQLVFSFALTLVVVIPD